MVDKRRRIPGPQNFPVGNLQVSRDDQQHNITILISRLALPSDEFPQDQVAQVVNYKINDGMERCINLADLYLFRRRLHNYVN